MVPAYGGLPVNTVYGRNSACVIKTVSKPSDTIAIEVGPGVDSGVEKPPDTKRCTVGSKLDVAAPAVIACVPKHNGGAVKVDSVEENSDVSVKGTANSEKYTENT